MHAVGLDIGGTKVAGGLVAADGSLTDYRIVTSPASSASEMEDAIVDMISDLIRDRDVSVVGIAVAGYIDADGSHVNYSPNIAWRAEPLRARLEERIPLKITLENDANAAGWAEFQFGAGREAKHMTMLTLGTGVGGAIVIDGRLVRGGFGAAGELGHVRVVDEGVTCGCGARGCLEQYGSGRALLRFASERASRLPEHAPLRQALGPDGSMDARALRELIESGDPHARAALHDVGVWVGRGCASIAAVLDPQVFVFGGGVSVAGDLLLESIRAGFDESVSARGYHPEPAFAIAQLGNDAGIVGAADLARRRSRLD